MCPSSVVYWRQYTTEEGHRSVRQLWSFYCIKMSQLRFILVSYIYIFIVSGIMRLGNFFQSHASLSIMWSMFMFTSMFIEVRYVDSCSSYERLVISSVLQSCPLLTTSSPVSFQCRTQSTKIFFSANLYQSMMKLL